MKMSSGAGRSIERGKQSQIASTSRWKCIVPLGLPVVPEVKAISATSSAAVSTLAKLGGLAAPCAPRAGAGAGRARAVEVADPRAHRRARARLLELVGEARVAQRVRDLRLVDDRRRARARAAAAWCATAMPPAFSTANQQAASIGLLAPRSSTRLPGTRPRSSREHVGDAVGLLQQLARRSSAASGVRNAALSPQPRVDRAVEQLGGAVQALRILQLGQLEDELRPVRRAAAGCRARRCRDAPYRLSSSAPSLSPRAASLHDAPPPAPWRSGEHLARDDELLHFGRALVDAQRADLAVQPLDRWPRTTPRAP